MEEKKFSLPTGTYSFPRMSAETHIFFPWTDYHNFLLLLLYICNTMKTTYSKEDFIPMS